MEKINQKFKEGKGLLTHRVDSSTLERGDHIYTYRGLGSYSHHGIYVGDGWVIHFIPTKSKGLSKQKQPCQKCEYQHHVHLGVVKTCLECFLSNGYLPSESLCRYKYGESSTVKLLKRSGTCSASECLPPETVVKKADELHKENLSGHYDLFDNNCEHFATYCKTGTGVSEQVQSFMEVPTIPSLLNFWKKKTKLSS